MGSARDRIVRAGRAGAYALRAGSRQALFGVALVVSRAAGLLTLPVYARLLGPEDFGQFELIVVLQALLFAVGILGLDYAMSVRFFQLDDRTKDADLASAVAIAATSSVTGAVVLAVLVPLIAALFGAPDAGPYLLALVSVPLNVVNGVFAMCLRLRFQAHRFFVSTVAGVAIGTAVGLVTVAVGGWGLMGAIMGVATTNFAMFLLFWYSVRGYLHPLTANRDNGRGLLRIGLPLVPANMAVWVFAVADRVLIAALVGFAQLGLYAAASRIVAILTVLQYGFHASWGPVALRWGSAPDRDLRYASSLRMVAIVGGAAVAVVSWLASPLISILAGSAYLDAVAVVWPLAAGALFLAMFFTVQIGANLAQRSALVAVTTVVAAGIGTAGNLLLIPRFGYIGAGFASLTAYVSAYVVMYGLSQRATPLRMQVARSTGWAIAWTFVAALSVVVPPAATPLASLGIILAAIASSFVAVTRAARVMAAPLPVNSPSEHSGQPDRKESAGAGA